METLPLDGKTIRPDTIYTTYTFFFYKQPNFSVKPLVAKINP